MSRIFFISDAHLGVQGKKEEEGREQLLIDFFQFVEKNGEGLFIVGDLFDFWFEYRYVVPRRYFRIMFALRTLVDRELKVEYITGNHDFGMDNFFKTVLGIPIHQEPLDITIDGKRLYVAHGDGLAKKDIGYRMLKKVLRNPLSIKLYRLLHPDVGFNLALFFSNLSRNHREIKNRDAEYQQYARARFAQGFDAVILAHTHQPQEFNEENHTYINTGDWITHFTYGKFEDGRLSLEYWQK